MDKLKSLLAWTKLKQVNLRWIKHAAWMVLLAGFFIYLNSSPPFLAIASSSMEPTLSRGDLIFTSNISPQDIRVGDIIVYKVLPTFQEKYGYPATVCHRIVRIQQGADFSFRTRGDATAEDPFMVTPNQIMGKESAAVPWLGYLVMFPQSTQGWIFLFGLVILYLLYANTSSIVSLAKNVRRSVVGMSAADYANSQRQLEQQMTDIGQNVAQSLNGFSGAMSEYAKHIASHTSAIKSLADAAGHMESILAKQDKALSEPLPPRVIARIPQPQQVIIQPAVPAPIEVTPDLKAAVKRFIQEYNQKNGITHTEVTPQLRAVVWDFVQNYAKNPPLSQQPEAAISVPAVAVVTEIAEENEDQPVIIAS
jgi:signal peptidase I